MGIEIRDKLTFAATMIIVPVVNGELLPVTSLGLARVWRWLVLSPYQDQSRDR